MTDRHVEARRGPPSELRGLVLLVLSALAFSTAGLFTHLAPVSLARMIFWRNSFGCMGLGVLLAVRRRDAVAFPRLGVRGWIAMAASALATVCYLAAFALTTVAEIAIIYATAPMIGACLAWVALGERPATRTLGASIAALVGVAMTVGGATEAGSLAGDGLALIMTATLAAVAVLVRGADLPPLPTALGSALLAALATLPAALLSDAALGVNLRDGLYLAAFGFITMTVALPAYLAGAARVPAGRAMLISALELPFAPLWIWLAWGEMPAPSSLVGGTLVLAAVLFDLLPARR